MGGDADFESVGGCGVGEGFGGDLQGSIGIEEQADLL